MNKARSTSWNDRLLQRQRAVAQSWPSIPSPAEVWETFTGTRAEVRQRGGVIPSWVLLGVIALTLTLLCFSLTLRTRASLNLARARYESEAARVEEIRRGNAEMEAEIKRLQTDPSAIADVAHQYGLIRPNEKVVLLR